MKTGSKEIFMYALGAFVLLGCFILTGILMFVEVPAGSSQALNICLGILIGLGATVVNFFYGSSKSSTDKTALLSKKIDEVPKPEDIP